MQDSLQTLSMPIHIDYIVLYAHITYSLKIYLLAQISSNLPKILIFIHMLLFRLKLIFHWERCNCTSQYELKYVSLRLSVMHLSMFSRRGRGAGEGGGFEFQTRFFVKHPILHKFYCFKCV